MQIVDDEEFRTVMEAVGPLLGVTRAMAPAITVLGVGIPEEGRPLAEESQAVMLAMQGVLNASRLKEAATVICLGGLVGSILGQCTELAHGELAKLFFQQYRETYAETLRNLTPQGNA